jgi:PIN domain nuclease of toxin-antitoxin system
LRLLLDTHIWLWSLYDPSRLGPRMRQELKNPSNELWLSPISTWEALILNEEGKISLPANISRWVVQASAAMREAPLTHEIVVAAGALQLQQHKDPGDRFLAATAQVLGLVLATADSRLLGLGEISTLANR